MRLRFGDCVFDAASRELRRRGAPQPLSPKAFQLLDLLLRTRPRALAKAEIHDALWPDTFVSESSLARLAAEVRAALGDDARAPTFVRTVYGFGYAFSGEAMPAPEASAPPFAPRRCRLLRGAREIPLPDGENVVGRSEHAAVWIDSTRVSRRHARIVVSAGRALLEDLGSKNGTFLRGRRIESPQELADGDEIVIGSVLLTFREGPARSTDTESTAAGRA